MMAPDVAADWFGTMLPRLDRPGVASPGNQSLAGVLARLYDSAATPTLVWLSFSLLLVAVGVTRARSAHADGDEITAFTLIGLTSAAVGPLSPRHELIWVVPAVLILADAAARRRVAARLPRSRRGAGLGHALAAAAVYLLFAGDPSWTLDGNATAFVLIVLLNALPWRPGAAPAGPPRRPLPVHTRVPAIPGPRGS
jgi:alpha-1,2-mannosyltransferase